MAGSRDGSGVGVVRAVLDRFGYRGPDEAGLVEIDTGHVLGAVRLAVTDPQGSHQPIRSMCQPVVLVCNGEIYNYRQLRRELQARGHRFVTDGDSEVVAHLYEDDPWGFANVLDGMFALAIHDRDTGALVLARDHLGVKPLFWRILGGALVFGSEATALAALPPRAGLDPEAVSQFLALRFTVSGQTMHQGIHELPPGCLLVHRNGCTKVHRYWLPELGKDVRPDLRAVVIEAITSCATPDAAAFLSGGLDSSVVSTVMADRPGPGPVSFSVGYDTDTDTAGVGGVPRPEDERSHARVVADAAGLDHREVVVRDRDVADILPVAVRHLDNPIFGETAVSTWSLARAAAAHGKVVLTGDGVDELLLGYDLVGQVAACAAAGGDWRERYLDLVGWLPPAWARTVVDNRPGWNRARGALLAGIPEDRAPLDQVRLAEITQRMPNYQLARVDRLTMAHGLEARVPYLRRAVVDAFLAHPSDRLTTGTRAKEPLLAAASDILPARIHARVKTKFSAPGMRWLTRTPLAAQLPELVLGSGHHVRLGLSRAGLETLLAAFTGDPHTHYMPTWGIFILFLWTDLHAV